MTAAKQLTGVGFNPHQHEDLAKRSNDPYGFTKYEILREWIRSFSPTPLSILNAGCGSGELSFLLAQDGHTIDSIEPVAEYVALARAEYETLPQDVRARLSFSQATMEEYQSTALYDVAISTDVLEHIEDDARAFASLVSRVKPGGLLLITVPSGPWLFGYHDQTLGHFRRYTQKQLAQLVSPFCQIRQIRHFGFTMIPVCLLFSCWLRRPYPVAQGKAPEEKTFTDRILQTLLYVDRALPLPFGTSLLLVAENKTCS